MLASLTADAVEMLAGADSDRTRTKVTLKRLGILRKYIYDCIHSGAMPKWEDVLTFIAKACVIEYAIGDANSNVLKVLRKWELGKCQVMIYICDIRTI
jgi:hypothetical protein